MNFFRSRININRAVRVNSYKINKLVIHLFIHSLETPREAKKAGQDSGMNPNWDNLKYGVMLDLNTQKYSDPKLGAMLLESGDAYLEETNTWKDIYWGVCNGVGQNNLGKILMDIRTGLKLISGRMS